MGIRINALAALLAGVVVLSTGPAHALAGNPSERWTPAPGQVFNDGWEPFPSGATFEPCQVVTWHFDRSGEGPERNSMIDDIRTGLASLEPQTGLTFEEVADRTAADLTFAWGDLAAQGYQDAAGIGGTRGIGRGEVIFSTASDWTLNKWAGRDWRRLEWPRPDLGPGWYSWSEGPGREALVVHEAMHAMGFDHVEDFTSIMYPQGGLPNNRGELSPGDIAGLNTMYLNQPCTPATPSPSEGSAVNPSLITGDSLKLRRVWRGTKVKETTVEDDRMNARVKTRLRPGARVTLTVGNYDEERGEWVEETTNLRVGAKGMVNFGHSIEKDDEIVLANSKGKYLARWVVSNYL